MTDRDTDFTNYYAARVRTVRNSAYLLCGEWHNAEDLTQNTFAKLYLVWDRVGGAESLDGYVRTMLYRTYLGQRRRGWFRHERPGAVMPDQGLPERSYEGGLDLLAALARVPARQRAVLVLRFWEDMSVEARHGRSVARPEP